MPKHGRWSSQVNGRRQSVAVHHPTSRGHAKACESIIPTQRATPKCWSPSPQFDKPRQSVAKLHPNSRGYAKVWRCSMPVPRQRVAFHHRNWRRNAKEWDYVTQTTGPSFLFLLPAPHKFEVQRLAMNKGEAFIGRSPSISLAAVTIITGFVQVMHVHQGRLWGQVIPQVGRQWCTDVLCHGQCQPSSLCQVWCSQCAGFRTTGHVRWVLGNPVS